MYFMDWGNLGRVESVTIYDASSGAQLASQSVSDFMLGKWLVWSVKGHVTVKYLLTGGPQVVLQGLFIDNASASAPAANTATFVKSDTTTGGSWVGTYGQQGYMIAGDTTSLPAFAQASINHAIQYTYMPSTTAPGCLQKGSNPADRIAATWYNGDFMTVDLNLTDGQTHQVAMYFMDWGNLGRVESVEIHDGDTGALLDTETMSSFMLGKWLVWNVKGHVTIKYVLTGGPQVVLQGLFIN
jgi:hypothetical protein